MHESDFKKKSKIEPLHCFITDFRMYKIVLSWNQDTWISYASFAWLASSSSGCQPQFLLILLRMLESHCYRTAAPRQYQWTERTPWCWKRKLQRKCSVPPSKVLALVIKLRVRLPLCDQIWFLNCLRQFSVNKLHMILFTRLMGYFPVLPVLLLKGNTGNQFWQCPLS